MLFAGGSYRRGYGSRSIGAESSRGGSGGGHAVLQERQSLSFMYPENYAYTKEHEWVSVAGDIGTIGITDHAQKELGDIVYVDLPTPGAAVTAHSTFGSVESVKAVSDLYSPVSGEVLEVNTLLATKPEKLNEDPHGEAWLVKVKLSSPDDVKSLLSAADYQKYIGE
jgi:glycine cleavage system H protein